MGTPFEDYLNLTLLSVDHCCTSEIRVSKMTNHFRNGSQSSHSWQPGPNCLRSIIKIVNFHVFHEISRNSWKSSGFLMGQKSWKSGRKVVEKVVSFWRGFDEFRWISWFYDPDGGHGAPLGSVPWYPTHYPGTTHHVHHHCGFMASGSPTRHCSHRRFARLLLVSTFEPSYPLVEI